MASTVWRMRVQQAHPLIPRNPMALLCGQAHPRPTKAPWTPNDHLRTRNYESAAHGPFHVGSAARATYIEDKARRYWEEQATKKGDGGPEIRLHAHNRMRDAFGGLSPSATKLYHDVSSGKVDAAQFLQETSLEGKDLLEAIRACLHGERPRLLAFKRDVRRAAMRQNLARVILDRIWGQEGLWRPLVLHDYTARFWLAYLAVAEDLTHLLIEWLQVHDDSNGWGGDKEQSLWRSALWRSIIDAHLLLEENRSADNALRCFFDICALRKKHVSMLDETQGQRMQYFALASPEPSCISLDRELSSSEYQNTDPAMYDRFIIYRTERPNYNPAMSEFAQASLHLSHPRSPTADLAYDFFRKRCEGEAPDSITKAMQPVRIHRNRLEHMLKRTCSLLDRADRHDDAAWIRKMTPSIVATKAPKRQPAEHRILSERP